MPDMLRVSQSRIGCQPDTVPLALVGNIAPTDYIINAVNKGFVLYGYTRSIDDCSDCRRQGGVTTPPPYW